MSFFTGLQAEGKLHPEVFVYRACRCIATWAMLLQASSSLFAQISPTSAGESAIALTAILDGAEKHIEAYRKSVPNVYCTEHAIAKRKVANSSMGAEMAVPGGSVPLERSATVENSAETTSIFRLKRLEEPSTTGLFEESKLLQRVTYSVDAPGYEEIAAPELLYGVFSNGLNILSHEGRACFHFDLEKNQTGKAIVIKFRDLPLSHRASECPADAEGRGTIKIDPVTMHVTQIERKLPHHLLVGGIDGSWDWKVEYAPTALRGNIYWFPTAIVSRSVSSDQRRIWSYSATYKDYHLFFSSTRILEGPGR